MTTSKSPTLIEQIPPDAVKGLDVARNCALLTQYTLNTWANAISEVYEFLQPRRFVQLWEKQMWDPETFAGYLTEFAALGLLNPNPCPDFSVHEPRHQSAGKAHVHVFHGPDSLTLTLTVEDAELITDVHRDAIEGCGKLLLELFTPQAPEGT